MIISVWSTRVAIILTCSAIEDKKTFFVAEKVNYMVCYAGSDMTHEVFPSSNRQMVKKRFQNMHSIIIWPYRTVLLESFHNSRRPTANTCG